MDTDILLLLARLGLQKQAPIGEAPEASEQGGRHGQSPKAWRPIRVLVRAGRDGGYAPKRGEGLSRRDGTVVGRQVAVLQHRMAL